MMKYLVLLFFFASTALAAITDFDRQELVYKNLLAPYNAGFESGKAQWTASGGTFAIVTSGANFSGIGKNSATWDSNAAAQTLTGKAITVPAGWQTQNCMISAKIFTPSGTATHTLGVYNGTTLLYSTTVISTALWTPTNLNFPCPSSGTIAPRITSVASDEPLIGIDDVYIGLATNLNQVNQAGLYGAITVGSCSGVWSTNATSMAAFSAQTGCAYTPVGNASAPSTNVPGIKFASLPPGDYQIVVTGQFGKDSTTTNGGAYFDVSDGTTSTTSQVTSTGSAGGTRLTVPNLVFRYSTSTTQSNVTLQVRGAVTTNTFNAYISGGAAGADGGTPNFTMNVYRFPSSGDTAYKAGYVPTSPTVQKFTSAGSTTYTTPTNPAPSYIRVRMVGGGGGGGDPAVGNGGAGGTTSFGTSLLSVNGGAAGITGATTNGGAGGAVGTLNSPAYGTNLPGGAGGAGSNTTLQAGGVGGSSALGGGGRGGGSAGTGSAGAANTGAGGGGGGSQGGASGSGGGSGGFIDAYIPAPLNSTYAVVVGAAGTAGGGNAGAGSIGYVEVTEYYGTSPAPLLIGSVTTNSSGLERAERATIVCSGSSSITTQSGSWVSSVGNIASSACAAVVSAGIFSGAPSCVYTIQTCAISSGTSCFPGMASTAPTSTSFNLFCKSDDGTNCTSFTANVHCMGPR